MMTETAKTPAVYAAICSVMRDMSSGGIGKGRRNQAQGFNFRGIDDVHNALSPVLSRHGLAMLPRVTERTMVEGTTKSGAANYVVTVRVEFDLVAAADGSTHTVCTYGEAMDMADKATNKAMSAAYKYAAIQTFCIPVEGQDDADAHTPEPAPRNAPRQPEHRPDPKPAPAPAAARPPADPMTSLLAVGWAPEDVEALGTKPTDTAALRDLFARARGGWRPDNEAQRKADAVLHLVHRRATRIREARRAGVLSAIVETHGEPSSWDHATVDRVKADVAAAGGAA